MSDPQEIQTLRDHRPLLLACEAIGWLHMAGKAHTDFLRGHGGLKTGYNEHSWYKQLPPPFDDPIAWASDIRLKGHWPTNTGVFFENYAKGQSSQDLVGLLQAGHAMASGIEKNVPSAASKYLGQDATHLWLSTAFGYPQRNLLADPPEILNESQWKQLLQAITGLLDELKDLGRFCKDKDHWHTWREKAIGSSGFLRKAFTQTLAETRLPNNDVTLWDQSYVAAALFKSAVAGAVLDTNFNWKGNLKQETKWRLLTLGMGADHYESQAVRIGDITGTRDALDDLFAQVRTLVEVDLALGSAVYADTHVCVFTFPGVPSDVSGISKYLNQCVDDMAKGLDLETPPYCKISDTPSRSLIGMTDEMQKARYRLAIPVHRPWDITGNDKTDGHVCPVCLVRFNGGKKQEPCRVCEGRQKNRRNRWLQDRVDSDTIWITEVADHNDRLALLTLSLDLDPWLSGQAVDSLRAQAIPEWLKHNTHLQKHLDLNRPLESLTQYIARQLPDFKSNDPVLNALQDGYSLAKSWEDFFGKIVEDRSDSPSWDELNPNERARWLAHQLLKKNASPGRVHRFWRSTQQFLDDLIVEFRQIASSDANRWRVRRVSITPKEQSGLDDGQVYNGRWRGNPISLVWLAQEGRFVSACNMARLLDTAQEATALKQSNPIKVKADNESLIDIEVQSAILEKSPLGVYQPLIVLERSPQRCRVLVPLAAAHACVDAVMAKWQTEFARVWDRMPVKVGVVAFPRMVPFQAVIETARNIEDQMDEQPEQQWRIDTAEHRGDMVALSFIRPDKAHDTVVVPVILPDGRPDVFYPYVRVEDRATHYPHDFAHPKTGQVYRHVRDLKHGDGVTVRPSRIATVFLDSTARRFEEIKVHDLSDWIRMQQLWDLVDRTAPSTSAVKGTWSQLMAQRHRWQDPSGNWLPDGQETWLTFMKAYLRQHLGPPPAAMDAVVDGARTGLLDWALNWHMTWLKQGIKETSHD